MIVFFCPLQAEKIVQCIANFPVNTDLYNHFLIQHKSDIKVVTIDIRDYEEDLLMRKGRFHRFLRKIHLDYPRHASVSDDVEKIVFQYPFQDH